VSLPARYNIVGYRGDSYALRLTFETPAGEVMPMPAEGWSAQVRKDLEPSRGTQAEFTVDASQATTGVVEISLTPAQTAVLEAGVWDIQCDDAGTVRTYLRGSVKFEGNVTR
jgi:hypothetical protein